MMRLFPLPFLCSTFAVLVVLWVWGASAAMAADTIAPVNPALESTSSPGEESVRVDRSIRIGETLRITAGPLTPGIRAAAAVQIEPIPRGTRLEIKLYSPDGADSRLLTSLVAFGRKSGPIWYDIILPELPPDTPNVVLAFTLVPLPEQGQRSGPGSGPGSGLGPGRGLGPETGTPADDALRILAVRIGRLTAP